MTERRRDGFVNAELVAVLSMIRDRGAIGERSLEDAIAHADRFVTALPEAGHRLVDLGSGGGLPGLVIAVRRPDVAVTLVERRRSRADLLRRAVSALGLDGVTVRDVDVAALDREASTAFDVVTARSFASPAVTAGWIGRLLRVGGLGLVSEPPEPDERRWTAEMLAAAGLTDGGLVDGLRRLVKR